LKVLWFVPYLIPQKQKGHPAPWIWCLLRELIRYKGLEIVILSVDTKQKQRVLNYKLEDTEIISLRVPNGYLDLLTGNIYSIKVIRNHLKNIKEKFDLIHIHGTETIYQYAFLGFGIPIITSIQGIIKEYYSFVPKSLFSFRTYRWFLAGIYEIEFMKKTKYFFCRTHWDSGYVTKYNAKAEIFKVWELIRSEFYQDHYSNLCNYVLFTGGSSDIKGIETALICLNQLRKLKDIKLIIMGRTDLKIIHSIISRHKLNLVDIKELILTGMLTANEMVKYFESAFCMLHPTWIDNSPNSVCEAQLSGLPVVASNVGGVSSLINDGVDGFLVEDPKDYIGYTDRIIQLCDNVELRKKISENGRFISRRRHNKKEITKNIISAYETILKNEMDM